MPRLKANHAAPAAPPLPGPTGDGGVKKTPKPRKAAGARSAQRGSAAPWLDASPVPTFDTGLHWGGGKAHAEVLPLFDGDENDNAAFALQHHGDPLLEDVGHYPLENAGYLDGAVGGWPVTQAAMAPKGKASSAISCDTATASVWSTTGSSLSSVRTEHSDTMTVLSPGSRDPSPGSQACVPADAPDGHLVCLRPRCAESFPCEEELAAHVATAHTHACNWAGCDRPSFASHGGLVWHVKAEHLLVCPAPACTETSFRGNRELRAHIAVAHPDAGGGGVKAWQLATAGGARREVAPDLRRTSSAQSSSSGKSRATASPGLHKDPVVDKGSVSVALCKRRCQQQLRSIVEKKARKAAGTPKAADSPTDLVRSRASRLVDMASFPLVFEHAVLPFLAEFLPRWSGPRHVVSVTRGRTAQARRLCIMTHRAMSRARRLTVASHVRDLLPENMRHSVSFVFSVGAVGRLTWARGLGGDHLDEVCAPRNPYFFQSPCMGDSIGIPDHDYFEGGTATLGPCVDIGGGSFWLGNFHPFIDAYRCLDTVAVQHPSPQDRSRCIAEAHDAMSPEDDFTFGDLTVTSGLDLKTKRISHDPYWEEHCKEPPLVVTDWALIASPASTANALRRFPSEEQPLFCETLDLVRSTAPATPGASVVSSGRTSGHQRGQVCEIPAYVSGAENGTRKATREWFVEEPWGSDDEDAWIRGGVGVEGDSGAAVVDADSSALVGQVWGRNRYSGPGPRLAYFTPIADVFDDIQEKCGQQDRPRLPQHRDEDDCYPVSPSCRRCYDLRVYLDSRRSSRVSMQSMIMTTGGDHDLTSNDAISELATPHDTQRVWNIDEALSFTGVLSPSNVAAMCPGTPLMQDAKSPYAPAIATEDLYDAEPAAGPGPSRKRPPPPSNLDTLFAVAPAMERHKRQRAAG